MSPFSAFRLVLLVAAAADVVTVPASQRTSFDSGWRFALGHAQDPALDFRFCDGSFSAFAKAGTDAGPIGLGFNDDRWQRVSLPHDWLIGLPFEAKSDMMHGYKPVGRAFPSQSVGWYRKGFVAPLAWKGKRVRLTFDGVQRDSKVWINGHWIGGQSSGSIGFTCDLTDCLKLGAKNVISVRVNASEFEGWYYEGAGIYRHAWLTVSPSVRIAEDGLALRPEVIRDKGVLSAEVEIVNDSDRSATRTADLTLQDSSGRVLGRAQSRKVTIPAWGTESVKVSLMPLEVKLWSPDSPSLYSASVSIEGDELKKAIGFRTVRFDAAKGLLINGVSTKIKGFCIHQDHAGVGTAVPDAINEWRIAQLKMIGANAIRTSHQPPTPEVLDACDRLGVMVLDETRLFGSTGEGLDTLKKLIRRDRNHPSVILWSLGNEEWGTQSSPESEKIAATMKRVVASLDPTRPVTFASNNGHELKGINSVVDVRGLNYGLGSVDLYKKARPSQPFHFSEVASTVTTRGEYQDDPKKGYVSAYDTQKISWGSSAEAWWKMTLARKWLMGGFVWTGFDYRGEPTPYSWPNISSHFGVLDTCGFRKDVAWYYKAWWTNEPVLHLLPHWNHIGKEGQPIDVWCFSNHEEVELFLNGTSLGRKKMELGGHLEWKVAYHPGDLKAVGFRKGKAVQETLVQTTGSPAKILLHSDRAALKGDGTDSVPIAVQVVDQQGRVVPEASQRIDLVVEGVGRIIGVGNGDPSCHESDSLPSTHEVMDVLNWRWRALGKGETAQTLQLASEDRSRWPGEGVAKNQIQQEGASAVFWTKFEVADPDAWHRITLGPIDDRGEVYLNGRLLGRTNDWSASHVFPSAGLRKGSNEILLIAHNNGGEGGFKGGVSLESKPKEPLWSRSVFHGLAQVILQSKGGPGKIKLRASAEGLTSAEIVLNCR